MNIYEILCEINKENGSNWKLSVLRKHSDNELLQRVLKMTYDSVAFTYGVTLKNVDHPGFERVAGSERTLTEVLDTLENLFATRVLTGHNAIDTLGDMLYCLSIEDRRVLHGVVDRDLKINMGRSGINKVFKNLIIKPVYMRCGLYNEKSSKKIDISGAYVQLKADGTYREFKMVDGVVSCISRTGEKYDYPNINHHMITNEYPNGHYIGELTVMGHDGTILDRATGNGMINSDEPPHMKIIVDFWDFVTLEEYKSVAEKSKTEIDFSHNEQMAMIAKRFKMGKIPYNERFSQLRKIVEARSNYNIKVIESHIVYSIKEALKYTSDWMNAGFEGSILKDAGAVFRDGTSPQQLKLKLEIEADVRIVGFAEGTPGTKREKTFGAIIFENDEGTIKGKTSGFTDKQLEDFNSRREELIGKIMTVQFNDLTQARGNDYYALSHPRFIELRADKTHTDDLKRIMEHIKMAKNLSP